MNLSSSNKFAHLVPESRKFPRTDERGRGVGQILKQWHANEPAFIRQPFLLFSFFLFSPPRSVQRDKWQRLLVCKTNRLITAAKEERTKRDRERGTDGKATRERDEARGSCLLYARRGDTCEFRFVSGSRERVWPI